MNMTLRLNARFDAVFLINGVFIESGVATVRDGEVTYVTVLPLSAVLLPYTVRLYGDKVDCNENLCRTVRARRTEIAVQFQPRYNYVYTPGEKFTPPESAIVDFFNAVKSGNYNAARTYLTAELSAEVSDEGLAAFFNGYDELAEGSNGECFISGKGRTATLKFTLSGGKIDDVTEE